MQEHFNENYVESDKFPKAAFDGSIDNIKAINFEKDGTYKSTVTGNLTIKGKTNKVSTEGTFIVKGGDVQGKATFKIKLADYNVTIPSVVKDKINEQVEIRVDMNYKPM
jgi:polyisoprenoid-binding protein YceI